MKKVSYKYGTSDINKSGWVAPSERGWASVASNYLVVTEGEEVVLEIGQKRSAPTFWNESDVRKYLADTYGWTELVMDTENVYA